MYCGVKEAGQGGGGLSFSPSPAPAPFKASASPSVEEAGLQGWPDLSPSSL